jgi:hypothetical protein
MFRQRFDAVTLFDLGGKMMKDFWDTLSRPFDEITFTGQSWIIEREVNRISLCLVLSL